MENFLQSLCVFNDNTDIFVVSQLVIFMDIMGLWVLDYFWRILKHHSLSWNLCKMDSKTGKHHGPKVPWLCSVIFCELSNKENQKMIECLESERSRRPFHTDSSFCNMEGKFRWFYGLTCSNNSAYAESLL